MTRFSIRRLASGGVITNYDCVSRCDHCLYNCGPHRSKDYLDPALAARIFQRIAQRGCRSVHIGGGEPLLRPQKLLEVLQSARKAAVGIDYVETNSAWFVDLDQAVVVLKELQAVGLRTLLISISPFHNAFIPYARVKGVIEACRRVNMNVFPWVNAFVRDLTRLDENRPHAMQEFADLFGADYLQRIPERYWIHLGGRALGTFRGGYAPKPLEQILSHSPPNCARTLGDTSHFHVDLYGNYIPGLCSGLSIAMEDLGAPLPEGKYPLIERLAADGIQGLYAFAGRTCDYVPSRTAYLNHCDLCTDIRNFLLKQKKKEFVELAPQGFYDEYSEPHRK